MKNIKAIIKQTKQKYYYDKAMRCLQKAHECAGNDKLFFRWADFYAKYWGKYYVLLIQTEV